MKHYNVSPKQYTLTPAQIKLIKRAAKQWYDKHWITQPTLTILAAYETGERLVTIVTLEGDCFHLNPAISEPHALKLQLSDENTWAR